MSQGERRLNSHFLSGLQPPQHIATPGREIVATPGVMPALGIGARVAVVDQRIAPRSQEIVARCGDLAGHAGDHRTLRHLHPRRHQRHRADHATPAEFRAVHHHGADADQAVVADLGAMHHGAMRDRTIVPDRGAAAAADMDHRAVLNVAGAADAHSGALGADHRIGPEAAALRGADAAEDTRGRIDVGRPIERNLGAEDEGHGADLTVTVHDPAGSPARQQSHSACASRRCQPGSTKPYRPISRLTALSRPFKYICSGTVMWPPF